jgi:hypothetical protein
VTVLAGRLPRLGAADEIVLTAGLARFFHAGVGGHVTYQFYRQNPANASVSAGRPTFVATGIVGIPPVLGDQFDQVNNAVLPRRPPPGTSTAGSRRAPDRIEPPEKLVPSVPDRMGPWNPSTARSLSCWKPTGSRPCCGSPP